MHDQASVRAEIKAWERSFKSKHGRAPTVDDIKNNSSIAAKYKLYKKLSKAASDKPDISRASSSNRSSTPPTTLERSSSLLPKSRVVETSTPLSSFNPFSPQKNKGKQRVSPAIAKESAVAPNPFATPSKYKPKPHIPQPSPSPAREPETASTSTLILPTTLPPEPSTAVTRARKRLRGEPVSPSPNKEKRRRVLTQTHLTFSRRDDSSNSDDEEDGPANSSFVDDSPVKSSAARSFKSLFEEAAESTRIKTALSRSKSTSGLFGPTRGNSVVDDDLDDVLGAVMKPKPALNGRSLSNRWLPGKDNLYSEEGSASQSNSAILAEREEPSVRRMSGKRVLPDSDSERDEPSNAGLTLIPPSPPPESTSQRPTNVLNKGKGKEANRKRTKLEEDGDTDSLSDDIKVLPSPSTRKPRAAAVEEDELDLDSDSDPVIQYGRHVNNDRASKISSGGFEVDLPDKLKHVLALNSSESQARDSQEERVFEHLIYGRRVTHYDPSKGGEIWDVGDVSGSGQGITGDGGRFYAEDEDDWEGEPVPWEIGEL